MSELRAALLRTIINTAEPGAGELCHAFEEALHGPCAGGPVEVTRLKSRVYRLSAGCNGRAGSFVLKRFDPWLARRNELVARRWLPALGLSDRCRPLRTTALSAFPCIRLSAFPATRLGGAQGHAHTGRRWR